MSDMFTRWLEESFRAGLRHRARTSSSRSVSVSSTTSSSSVSSSPSYFSGSSSESSGTSGVFAEEPRRRQAHEHNSETSRSRRGLRFTSSGGDVSIEIDTGPNQDNDDRTAQETHSVVGNVSSTTSVELIPHSEEGNENVSRSASTETHLSETSSSCVTLTSIGSSTMSGEHSPEASTSTPSLTREHDNTADTDRLTRGGANLASARDQSVRQADSPNAKSSFSTQNRSQKRTKNARKSDSLLDNSATASCSHSELPSGERSSLEVTQETTRASCTRAEPTPRDEPGSSRNVSVGVNNNSEVSDQTAAATRIQRVYRLHKKIHSSSQYEEQDIWIPEMTRVYKGHRNARTMVGFRL